jgi:hypothetical protein
MRLFRGEAFTKERLFSGAAPTDRRKPEGQLPLLHIEERLFRGVAPTPKATGNLLKPELDPFLQFVLGIGHLIPRYPVKTHPAAV